jgi:hypothetical protein
VSGEPAVGEELARAKQLSNAPVTLTRSPGPSAGAAAAVPADEASAAPAAEAAGPGDASVSIDAIAKRFGEKSFFAFFPTSSHLAPPIRQLPQKTSRTMDREKMAKALAEVRTPAGPPSCARGCAPLLSRPRILFRTSPNFSRAQAQAQINMQAQQAMSEKMMSICLKRCLTSPTDKLTDKQRRCLDSCTSAFLEGFTVAVSGGPPRGAVVVPSPRPASQRCGRSRPQHARISHSALLSPPPPSPTPFPPSQGETFASIAKRSATERD